MFKECTRNVFPLYIASRDDVQKREERCPYPCAMFRQLYTVVSVTYRFPLFQQKSRHSMPNVCLAFVTRFNRLL